MRIVKLAAGLATGYVLGARAGREKYDQITAVAGKLTGRPITAPAEREVEGSEPQAEAVTAPAVVSSGEQPAPVAAGAKPRRPRNRRPKTVAENATAGASDRAPATGTADLGIDTLPMEAAEADVVEQHMLVVDNTEESALTPSPLESDAADAREQRRSL